MAAAMQSTWSAYAYAHAMCVMRRVSTSVGSRRAFSSASASPVRTVFAIYMPQLSPSMTTGRVSQWYVRPAQRVARYDLLFDVHTEELLEEHVQRKQAALSSSPSSSSSAPPSPPPSHTLEIESQDDGVFGNVLFPHALTPPTPLIPVHQLIAYMIEDSEDSENTNSSDTNTLARAPLEQFLRDRFGTFHALDAAPHDEVHVIGDGATDPGRTRVLVRPLMWQAYVREGERQTGCCVPSLASCPA